MNTCCCSMAGTRACDMCANGPSQYGVGYVLPSHYLPVESTEEVVRRVLKEILNADTGQDKDEDDDKDM